mmetsp:Transcript_34960/g.41745  ORF Transcript_34960/g.41745 Transcript_34960/m.41745 type:complete len:299 (-) Transcript_34960:412-1308(-)
MEKNEIALVYKSGIPTLRSSAHRVRKKIGKNRNVPKPQASGGYIGTMLPSSIRERDMLPYDVDEYDLSGAIISLLQSLDPEVVGSWSEIIEDGSAPTTTRLEDFRIPLMSVTRRANKGQCEDAQQYLSEAVASSHDTFLQIFDRLLKEQILPHLKSRLVREGVVKDDETRLAFYYQRPPTLRLQPGPARAMVRNHRDSDYGHQPGELNYWIPLTDIALTGVDLWCESDADLGDYSPLGTQLGEVSSFHGTACRHYVNRNETPYTRASLDFRVGIEPYYDPEWEMVGTRADHLRQKVEL